MKNITYRESCIKAAGAFEAMAKESLLRARMEKELGRAEMVDWYVKRARRCNKQLVYFLKEVS